MKIITVTAGHGGTDPGNTWGGEREADLMRELRGIVALKLRDLGHEVREDGGRHENRSLSEAARLVAGSDVAVELHTNASQNVRAEGVEVVADVRHGELAQRLAHAIGGVLQIPARRRGGWFDAQELRAERGFYPGFVRAGGLIVETFFQSNPRELQAYRDRKWLVASAIARVLDHHVRLP